MDSCVVLLNRGKIGSGVGETSLSSSSISKNDYEVFLSFRGPDTRQGFTDCLYHALIDAGIRVFRDDDELALGDKIDEILTALNNSKICVVVLSPTFSESSWCLREVKRMVDMKKDIVPIFYHVTPDDVKLKTKLYANYLTAHETKHGKETVQQWRGALVDIPTIKGRALKNIGYIEFTRQIAKEMLTKLKVKHKYEIKNLVQVPDEVEAALNLLDIGSEDGRRLFVGIHGMGGLGKTTLAKIIFNQILDRFDCSCFLENIRDYSSQGPDGVHKLQEQMLKSLDPSMRDSSHIFDPMDKIQTNFQRKKVIIVLDDVDQKSHLDSLVGHSSWFGEGSRIIFTTRNAELHEQRNSSDAHFYGLEKKEMDSEQALTLFSKHAFGEDSPPKDFKDLSIEAISTTGRLPLALEVVGSLLHRRKVKVWREMIKKLKEAPHQDVQQKLKLSYDALDVQQQDIFLDIACFFIGVKKTNAVYMWEACEFDPNYGIEVLISMSLIKLNEKKCFLMHDQLRDLGRAIVNVNSEDVRAAGSKFWRYKDATDLLKRNVGKEKVKALCLEEPISGYWGRENFVGLDKLRFLQFTKFAEIGGDFSSLVPKLRWLSLLNASSFNVTNLYLAELVVLELFLCGFNETWPGWGQILISKQLKVLTLSHCSELTSTPDLSKTVNLERLVIKNCGKLIYIHSSVGKLQRLRHLSIIRCHSFYDLPESVGCLVSLKRLEVEGAANLPNGIGQLVKLKHLSLRYSTHIRVVPDSIGDLRSLVSLDLLGSGITELPTTIDRLAKLESLFLCRCRGLQRLPDSIGNLHSLIDLDVRDTSITELPRSFGNLASLQKLDLTGSSVKSVSMEWGGLQQLKTLRIGCPSLEFGQCELPSNIESLDLHVKKWGKLPLNLSSMKNLLTLKLDNFVIEEEEDGFFNVVGIEELESSLVDLKMEECIITCLDITQFNHLVYLDIWSCKDLVDIQGIGKLKSLKRLRIYFCHSLLKIEDLSDLNGLVSVDISCCKNLVEIQGIGKLKSLKELYLQFCHSLRKIEDLSKLNRQASIRIYMCKEFEEEGQLCLPCPDYRSSVLYMSLSEISLSSSLT